MTGFAAAMGPALIALGKLIPIVNDAPKKILDFANKLGQGTNRVIEFGKSLGGNIHSNISNFIVKITR